MTTKKPVIEIPKISTGIGKVVIIVSGSGMIETKDPKVTVVRKE